MCDTHVYVIHIDLNDPKPLEEQIAAGVRQAIARGEVGPGEELPTVRQLAGDLGVHWNTVARAYRRLADEHVLVVRRGRGAVVRDDVPAATTAARSALRDRLVEVIATGRVRGLSTRDISAVFQDALKQFGDARKS